MYVLLYYAVPEGESSVVYIRFLIGLRNIPGCVQDSLFMAYVEKVVSTLQIHVTIAT